MKISWKEEKKGLSGLIFLAAIFASYGLYPRYLSNGFELFEQVYLRILIAFVASIIFFFPFLKFKRIITAPKKDLILLLLRSLALYVGGVVLGSQAVIVTKYSNVAFISALPMIAVLGVLLLGERLTLKKSLYIIMAFFGVILIAVQNFSDIFSFGTGETLAILSTIFIAISYIGRKWQSNHLNNQEITVSMLFIGMISVFLVSIGSQEKFSVESFSIEMSIVLILAGVINALGMFLTNYVFEKVEAIIANNFLTLSTVFALVFGFVFFQELPTVKELIGGFIIVTSVILMNNEAKRLAYKK